MTSPWKPFFFNSIQFNSIQWETFWDDRGQQTYRVNPLFSELCACSELRKQWKLTRYVCCHLALESLLFNSIQFNSIQFNSVQFNSIQFNSIQSNSILFFIHHVQYEHYFLDLHIKIQLFKIAGKHTI